MVENFIPSAEILEQKCDWSSEDLRFMVSVVLRAFANFVKDEARELKSQPILRKLLKSTDTTETKPKKKVRERASASFQEAPQQLAQEAEVSYSRELAVTQLSKIKDKYEQHLSPEQWEDATARIELIFDDYEGKSQELDELFDGCETAFVVHSTQLPNNPSAFASVDLAVTSYALTELVENCPEAGPELYEYFVKLIPPFRAGIIKSTKNKESKKTAIIVVPLDILQLTRVTNGWTGFRNSRQVAQLLAKYYHSFRWAHNQKNINTFGLGAIGASISDNGKKIRALFKPNEVITTTGHPTTVAFMIETTRELEKQQIIDFSKKDVAVMGCGRIGSAYSSYLLSSLVSELEGGKRNSDQIPNFYLFDNKNSFAIRLAEQLRKLSSTVEITILVKKKPTKMVLNRLAKLNISTELVPDRKAAIMLAAHKKAFIIGADKTIAPEALTAEEAELVEEARSLDDSVPHLIPSEAKPFNVVGTCPGEDYSRQGIDTVDGHIRADLPMDYGKPGSSLIISSSVGKGIFGCEHETKDLSHSEQPDNDAVWGSVTLENTYLAIRRVREEINQGRLTFNIKTLQGYGRYILP